MVLFPPFNTTNSFVLFAIYLITSLISFTISLIPILISEDWDISFSIASTNAFDLSSILSFAFSFVICSAAWAGVRDLSTSSDTFRFAKFSSSFILDFKYLANFKFNNESFFEFKDLLILLTVDWSDSSLAFK